MVNIVSNQRIAHQSGDFFGGATTRTRKRTGVSLEDKEFSEHVARCRTAFALMVMMFFVAGCGLHMHRPEDAQLARAASTAFKDAKLTDTLKAEFDAATEILNSEIAVIRRHSNARRDQTILNITRPIRDLVKLPSITNKEKYCGSFASLWWARPSQNVR